MNSSENYTSSELHSSSSLRTVDDFLVNRLRISLLSCNLLFGVPMHCYVLWLIARKRRIPSELFNVNLTVCELIYSLVLLPHLLRDLTNLEILRNFLQGLGITGRPLFQCLICVERYLAVVHPVTFLKSKPLRYRLICCVVVWIFTLASCLSNVIIQMLPNRKTYVLFFFVQYFLFLWIQLFCLVAVLRALKQSGPGDRRRDKEEENHMKRRAFLLILIISLSFIVMFVPFIVTGFSCVLDLAEESKVSLMWFLSLCFFILAGFVQPVLYLHRAGKLVCFCSS